MVNHFRKGVFAFAALLMLAPASWAGSTNVALSDVGLGFMNVFELPENGGGFVFGQPWGFADLKAEFIGPNLQLGPGTVDAGDGFWYQNGTGGPGAAGNKVLQANAYGENIGGLAGQTVTFEFEVLSNTLDSGYQIFAFIRDFAADFQTSVDLFVPLTAASGMFSLSLDTINDPSRVVQWGFQVVGPNVWPGDEAALGNVLIGPATTVIPVPAAVWLMGSGLLGLLGLRRRSA